MQIEGATIREQGQTFQIVVVKRHVVDNKFEGDRAIESFQQYFLDVPIVLMGQDYRGIPKYYGRSDIARFLANIDPSRIPWKRYYFN